MTQTATQDKSTNAFDLAALYLTRAGLPNTWVNQRILAAWFMAESSRIGNTNINVHNNNPLNITTTSEAVPYHILYRGSTPIKLKFVSYGTAAEGADAWASLVQRKYPGIWLGFKAQSPAAVIKAISKAPWGTSAKLVQSSYNSIPSSGTLGDPNKIDVLRDSRPPTPGPLGAWYINGVPTVTFQEGHTITAADVDTIAGELDKAGFFNSGDPIASALAIDQFKGILRGHIGEQWNNATLIKIGGETGTAAVAAGSAGGLSQALTNIDNFLDPTKMVPRFVHIGAILLGGIMVGYGFKILIGAAGASDSSGSGVNISVGGGGGGGVERYPFIIHEGGTEMEGADLSAPGTTNKHPLVSKPRRSKGDFEYPEYVDHSDQNPSTTTAPLRNVE